MDSINDKQNNVVLTGRLAEFRQALKDEIEKIEKSGQSSTLLSGGRRIESPGAEFWYRFRVEYLPVIPADTPCKLIVVLDSYDVTVVSFEESSIVIASKVVLPDIVAKARLENGATVLLDRLIKRIEANSTKKNPAGERMLRTEDLSLTDVCTHISDEADFEPKNKGNDNQNRAIKSALTNDITYIWGPPGTGKTTVIGQIINELLRRERSVLLVSHTNSAVDGAIKIVDKEYDTTHINRAEAEPYPILRVGTPSIELENRIQIKNHISILGRELQIREAELDRQKTVHESRLNIIVPQIRKVQWVQENRLVYADSLLNEMDHLESAIQVLCHRQNAQEELKIIKTENIQYKEYESIQTALVNKEQELSRLKDRMNIAQSDLEFIPDRILAAKDEVIKHEKHAELTARAAQQLSIPTQKDQIAQIKAQIENLLIEEKNLTQELNTLTEKINEYNQKGSLAKFLAGKSAVIQATERTSAINTRLPEIHTLQKAKALTLQNYENQLIESMAIQEQLNAITLYESKEEWQRRIRLMTAQIERAQNELPLLEEEIPRLEAELPELRSAFCISKNAHDAVLAVEQKLAEIKTQLKQKHGALFEKKKECSNLLKAELSCCESFGFYADNTELHSTCNTLIDLLQQTKIEVRGVEASALKSEEQEIQKQIGTIKKELEEIGQKMNELEKQAIMQAKVIGTTLAKSYLNDTIQGRSFDTVILDEASMASIPALWCACYLAERNIVIVGDFKQLPPIVMADTPVAQEWLGKDIFKQSGMQERLGEGKILPPNFVVLDKQFRMEEEIANIANMYYEVEGISLKSDDSDKQRCNARDKFYQWYSGKWDKTCIHLIDTKNLHAWVTGVSQGKGHSRLNCFSATLCVDLAFRLLENKLEEYMKLEKKAPEKSPSVLIVAPYKPHIAKINQLIELEYKSRGLPDDLNLIRAGTIHSFQGNEADIVIFDLVMDEPHWKANLFMPDEAINDDLKKMFNVAVTRAKFKLFVVGNFSYCQKRAKNNALGRLLDYLIVEKRYPIQDAKALFPQLTFAPKDTFAGEGSAICMHLICREDSFYDHFLTDVKQCREKLLIYSPFMTQERLSGLLPYFSDADNRGCNITVITKALTDRGKNELAHYQKCEEELRNLNINIIHKKGMHEKLVFVDDDVIWMGSLNVLSFTGLTGEVMHRLCDRKLAEEYSKLFDIEHLFEVAKSTDEQVCPICGGEMLAAESDNGGFYWVCANRDYSRQPTQQYPRDGVIRCKCGADYVFAMKKQPRWVCSATSSHYQLVRESDLKLEKMLALIPQKERKAVIKYFSDK